ncbi:MAG: sigma-54 dependent transcriptional regulator [Deltaproteobacteria bacterium]|jgi:two-component system NtrC family response regulator|nr:sigma-54 dependent transcriptional regulator [Deltaproteobacteria bacterium]
MLSAEGYEVFTAGSGDEAFLIFEAHPEVDLVLTDMTMPNGSGIELLEKVKETRPEVPVIMLTAHGTVELAVKSMKRGAFDYLTKPYKNDELTRTVAKALEVSRLSRQNKALKEELAQRHSFGSLIGKSKKMLELYKVMDKVASSRTNVLITGESGTGKELVARAIHFNSPRKNMPFVPVNCSALSASLMESELFGHEKGSFTGADTTRPGRFEVAHKGTLFLDEVGEISPNGQVKLLRAIQERAIERVGGTASIQVDVRLVAATNRDLKEEVMAGRFREDLFYRLNVVHIPIPPLRDRLEDLPLLITHFLVKHGEGRNFSLDKETLRLLYAHNWPGNVRELENVIERGLVLATGEIIFPEDLPPELREDKKIESVKKKIRKSYEERESVKDQKTDPSQEEIKDTLPIRESRILEDENKSWVDNLLQTYPIGSIPLTQTLLGVEEGLLRRAMEQMNGVQAKAADLLGIKRNVFKYKWEKFVGSAESPVSKNLSYFLPEGKHLSGCLDELEETLIRVALIQTDWVQSQAADLLGLRRNLLLYKINKYPNLVQQIQKSNK